MTKCKCLWTPTGLLITVSLTLSTLSSPSLFPIPVSSASLNLSSKQHFYYIIKKMEDTEKHDKQKKPFSDRTSQALSHTSQTEQVKH